MKQHITKEQWDEINDEHKGILYPRFPEHRYIDHYKKITIGNLIEFLGEDLNNIHLINNEWIVGIHLPQTGVDHKELIDSLWQATKFKLKN